MPHNNFGGGPSYNAWAACGPAASMHMTNTAHSSSGCGGYSSGSRHYSSSEKKGCCTII